MTEQQHPITPPPELIQQWRNEWYSLHSPVAISTYVATRAAQWSADQEREEICKWLEDLGWYGAVQDIRAAHIYRRPKPPSLKQQALEAAQRPTVKPDLTVPSSSLMEQVARAISGDKNEQIKINWWKPEARHAILATANWLDQQELHDAATRLRQEVRVG